MTDRPTIDEYYMGIARDIAKRSKDRATQVGAVVVGPDKEIRSTGYNGFARGIDDDIDERHERPLKYYLTVHAEENAIINAARVGTPIQGCTVYVSARVPCSRCMGMLVNAGIGTIVVETMEPSKRKSADWTEQHQATEIMMKECLPVVRLVNELIDEAENRMRRVR